MKINFIRPERSILLGSSVSSELETQVSATDLVQRIRSSSPSHRGPHPSCEMLSKLASSRVSKASFAFWTGGDARVDLVSCVAFDEPRMRPRRALPLSARECCWLHQKARCLLLYQILVSVCSSTAPRKPRSSRMLFSSMLCSVKF